MDISTVLYTGIVAGSIALIGCATRKANQEQTDTTAVVPNVSADAKAALDYIYSMRTECVGTPGSIEICRAKNQEKNIGAWLVKLPKNKIRPETANFDNRYEGALKIHVKHTMGFTWTDSCKETKAPTLSPVEAVFDTTTDIISDVGLIITSESCGKLKGCVSAPQLFPAAGFALVKSMNVISGGWEIQFGLTDPNLKPIYFVGFGVESSPTKINGITFPNRSFWDHVAGEPDCSKD